MEIDSSFKLVNDPRRPDWICLALSGEMTTNIASRLHQTALLLISRDEHVAISLEGVTQLGAATLQVILCLARELARKSLQCDLTGINDEVRSVFSVTGLNR